LMCSKTRCIRKGNVVVPLADTRRWALADARVI
jgi:hypothetical protein